MPKKKGGKMGNMTEEDRIAFLEQQRLAEEEMQKNKEDMLAQFLRVCLFNNINRIHLWFSSFAV